MARPVLVSEIQSEALSAGLLSLARSDRVSFPIRAHDLLIHLITSTPRTPDARPVFRLNDKRIVEAGLEIFERHWEHGTIFVQCTRDMPGELVVVDIHLGSRTRPVERKRKRSVKDENELDEYGDSASSSDVENDTSSNPDEDLVRTPEDSVPRLGQLPVELKEVYAQLQRGTAKGKLMAQEFRSELPFEAICPHTTKVACIAARMSGHPSQPVSQSVASPTSCDLIHYRPIHRAHTDSGLGHCSYLNTCYSEPTYALSPSVAPSGGSRLGSGGVNAPNANSPVSLPSGLGAGGRGKEKAPCRYLHFEVDWDEADAARAQSAVATNSAYKKMNAKKEVHKPVKLRIGQGPSGKITELKPPQWINCDVRRFDYSVLGKFHVIMADPPWDIHMSLPYGTMTDDEMRAMPIPMLQDEGFLFLWVTGRAMEVGRECMRHWGYTRVDEVIWVKTNQLQRVIRTGRTGHWLNHTKEHMLVGVKTRVDERGELIWPLWANRGLDTDVIVSEVRETSRKPDEAYGLIERVCPGGRKIEIFGRKHNTRSGWLTLGNQLGQDQIHEEDLLERVLTRYPERAPQQKPSPAPPITMPNLPQGGMGGPPLQRNVGPPMGPPAMMPQQQGGMRHHLPMNPNRAIGMNGSINMHMGMGGGMGGGPMNGQRF